LFCFFFIFFLLISFKLVELIYRIQTSKNYSFLLLNEQVFLFVKAKYLRYNFFDLSIKIFFLYLDGLLVRYKRHFVLFAIVIYLVLTGALSITGILGIRDSYVIARLAIEVNGFLITNI
jgi:hypothetical protein